MALALIVGVNFGLLLWDEAPLISSGQTADQWNRSCKYYFPVPHHRTQVAAEPKLPGLGEAGLK